VNVLVKNLAKSRFRDIDQKGIKIRYRFDIKVDPVLVDDYFLDYCLNRIVDFIIGICGKNHDEYLYLSTIQKNSSVHLSLGLKGGKLNKSLREKIERLFELKDLDMLEIPELHTELLVAKGIVDIHGGQIFLDDSQGRKFKIEITLPVYRSAKE
jgi:hypothetical protein